MGDLDIDERGQHARKLLRQPIRARNRTAITLALVEVFSEALDQGRILTPAQMVTAMSKRYGSMSKPSTRVAAGQPARRWLALQLDAIEHAYCTAARIYTDHFRDSVPTARNALRGRQPWIDVDKELLLRAGLSDLQKARLLGLPTRTPEEKRRAKDVVRKRRDSVEKREKS
jgi:hypothetical protein